MWFRALRRLAGSTSDYFSGRANERKVYLVLEFNLRRLAWIVWTAINDERVESVLEFGAIRAKDAGIPFRERSVLGYLKPRLPLSRPKEM